MIKYYFILWYFSISINCYSVVIFLLLISYIFEVIVEEGRGILGRVLGLFFYFYKRIICNIIYIF